MINDYNFLGWFPNPIITFSDKFFPPFLAITNFNMFKIGMIGKD